MKTLAFVALGLALLLGQTPALAQSSAQPVLPGSLTTSSCPPRSTSCYVPYSNTNPLPVSGTFSATLSGFAPNGSYGTPLSVSGSSAETALPTGVSVAVFNTGPNVAYINLGTSGSVTATTSDMAVPAGGGCVVTVGANTNIAAITASSTTTLNTAAGSGLGDFCWGGGSSGGGGGGGAVTMASGAVSSGAYVAGSLADGALTTLGAKADAATCATSNTLMACTRQMDADVKAITAALGSPLQAGGSVSLTGTLPGFATTPTVNLGTLNGAATAANQPALNGDGGALAHVTNFPATQPISASALPLPSGAATSALQSTISGDITALGTGALATDAHMSTLITDITTLGTGALVTDSHFTTIFGTSASPTPGCTGPFVIGACLAQLHSDMTSAPTPGSSSGGYLMATTLSLSNTVTQVVTGAHQLVGAACDAPNSAVTYIAYWDVASAGSVTLGTTTPSGFFPAYQGVPAGWAPQSLVGKQFVNGIFVAAVTTGPKGSGAPATAENCEWDYK